VGLPFGMRFDFRNPEGSGTTSADRYEAALEMVEWGERLGCVTVMLAEHHGSEDDYIPSPLVMLAAMAARTSTVGLSVAALIAPFYDPLRLAEDLLVLDHLSRGRVSLVVAAGYVEEEFELYGVPMVERVARVTEVVTTVKAAFTGEPFEYRGRTVRLAPRPYSSRVRISLGGSSEGAARRAARIADGFIPSDPQLWATYREERVRLGRRDPGPDFVATPRTVALAEDPERGWEQMGPHFLHEANAYGALQRPDGVGVPFTTATDVAELRATGEYQVLRPQELVEELRASPVAFPFLNPLCGGMPIDLAWSSLRLFEREVLPAFA
jgi:alkanesulfonate monooxygenase SsuD/methylene tetrahydromethanopterin reductase-like flavin-dependent oxidoreductase (luciferase family)